MVTGFFKKLKNKLFNSSSKFTKNLDEAVNEVSKAEVDVNIEKKVSVEKSEKDEINSKKISESEKSQFAKDGDTDQNKDTVKDGQKVTNTHTPGHVVFHHAPSKLALVGDVLFAGSVGRTDFPRGNHPQLLESIVTKLWPLGDDTTFIPGHGPASSFAHERRTNMFVSDAALAA